MVKKIVTLACAIVIGLAVPASAGGTVYCGTGGQMYTTGYASNTNGQSHYRGTNKAGPYALTYKQVWWGYHSGNQSWDVKPDTAPITSESAVCPT